MVRIMKKRLLCIALAAALAFLLLSGIPAAADEKLGFISINDTLPPELINGAISYGGLTYVPYYTFSNYGLGVSYTYFSFGSTAELYTRDRQLFFELTSGKTYDGDGTDYSGAAILRSGAVYLPLGLVCRFFDHISYSYIAGNEYGSILRITTGDVVLSDAEFLQAARTLMSTYYADYNSRPVETDPPAGVVGTPEPMPARPTPAPAEETHEGEKLTLSFSGAPTAETLDALDRYGVKTCFFLSVEEIPADPDALRRALGAGHTLGIRCGGDPAEFSAAAALLFEAAKETTILIAPEGDDTEEYEALTATEDLVVCESEYVGAADLRAVAEWLEGAARGRAAGVSLRLGTGEGNLVQVLNYLTAQKYDIAPPREV